MNELRLRLFLILLGLTAISCAHAFRSPAGCDLHDKIPGWWQVDRIEPPWLILLNTEEESFDLPSICLPAAREGMVYYDGRRDRASEENIRRQLKELQRKTRRRKSELLLIGAGLEVPDFGQSL